MQLKEKIAIITGGAGGIGAGLVRSFVNEGAKVLFVDINEEKGRALEKELSGNAKFIKEDLASVDMEKRILEAVLEHFNGSLHILVNNAQASTPKLLLDTEQSDLDLSFNTGLWPTWKLMRACYEKLKESKGSIINFASGTGLLGLVTHGAYSMNKEAIRGLTRTAANEWGGVGIRVNVVCPGAASEGFIKWRESNKEQALELESKVPLGRVGDIVHDIAPVIVFLASDSSQYITGQTIMADGGSIMLR